MADPGRRRAGAARTCRRRARALLALAAVFLLALAVRSLYAVDLAPVMYSRVQPGTRMAWRHDEAAVAILRGEGILWPRHPDPARTGLLARPPGYPLLSWPSSTAGLGRSFFAAQLVQNALDLAGCVLLAAGGGAARAAGGCICGGLVAALSPHLAFSSNFLLPDALSALPLLAALAVLARAHPGPRARWWVSAVAGALVGAGRLAASERDAAARPSWPCWSSWSRATGGARSGHAAALLGAAGRADRADHPAQLRRLRRMGARQHQRRAHALAGGGGRGRGGGGRLPAGQAGHGRGGGALRQPALPRVVGGAGRHLPRPRALPARPGGDPGASSSYMRAWWPGGRWRC